jgi:hypothetical protein
MAPCTQIYQYSFPSFLSLFSLLEVLYDPNDLIWRQETPHDAMTGRTTFIDSLLADVSRSFHLL